MPQIPPGSPGGIFSTPAGGQAFPYGEGGRAQALTDEGCPATENKGAPMYLRPRTVGRLPCVKGAVGRRLTEGSAKAFLLNRVLSKHPALSIPPSRLRRATSLYAREAASGGGGVPSSVPGCARSTFPGGEGFLRRGRSPSSVPGCARSTFPVGEGFLRRAGSPSSVPGCARSTFPGGEGCLRRGKSPVLPQGKAGDHRQDMTGHLPLRSSKRFTGGYQFSSMVPVRPWRFLATLM